MMRRAVVLAVLVGLAVLVAACSGDDDGGSNPAASASASTSTAGVTTTAATGDDVELADGRLVIPAQNVGAVDLTTLPVGDDHVVTDAPGVGDLYLCSQF